MSAAAAPRLTGGVVASILLHGAIVAAFLLQRSPSMPASPPMVRVQLIAAPAGPRTEGVVQVQPPVAVETPPPTPKASAPKPRPLSPVAKAKTPPTKAATPTATPPKTAETKPQTGPVAGGGPVGGRGADVVNIDTPGIDFDYPYYTNNVTRKILERFGEMSGRLEAEVRFVIRRDGSVDPESIRFVSSSGNYTFDQKALAAVEAAANAKSFGPLPTTFREDILPVTFKFSPRIVR